MAPPTKEQTWRYEHTPKGFLVRKYRGMLSRVVGVQRREAKYYEGLAILPKQVFYLWAWEQPVFWTLFRTWELAGYDQRLTPSIDRIDSALGYTLDNMQWLTHSANSAKVRPELRQQRKVTS